MAEDVDLEALVAATKFVETLRGEADNTNPYPLWHGWALRDSFLAGIKWRDEHPKEEAE